MVSPLNECLMGRVDCHWLAREGMHFTVIDENFFIQHVGVVHMNDEHSTERQHVANTIHKTRTLHEQIYVQLYTLRWARGLVKPFLNPLQIVGRWATKENNGKPCVRKRVYVSKVFEELTAEFLEARNARIRKNA